LITNNVQPPAGTAPGVPTAASTAITAWCTDLFDRFVAWMQDRTDRELTGLQAVMLAATVLTTVGTALVLGGWFAYELVRALIWVFSGHAGAEIGHLVAAVPVAHVALDPISAWVRQHAAGLPVSPAVLLTVWGIGGATLVVTGLSGSLGARIAWPVYGAATTAMAWFGATEPHRPIAAGLIVLAWGLASILVLRRRGDRAGTHISVLPATCNHAPGQPSAGQPGGDGVHA
jgi:hypothetical protein